MLKKSVAAVLLSLASLSAFAIAPDAVIDAMSARMLEKIPANMTADQASSLVDELVMPHVDFEAMTAHAVGKNWREATPAQRTALTVGFRGLLLRTYSGALQEAKGASVRVLPLRQVDATTAVVKSEVRGKGEPIPLAYRMEAHGDDWKIVDLSVMGVWIVSAYSGSFTTEIGRSGIDGLIKVMQDKLARKS